jgi:hypothetical protein
MMIIIRMEGNRQRSEQAGLDTTGVYILQIVKGRIKGS